MTDDKGFFPSRRREMGYMGSLGNDIIDWQSAKTQQHKLEQRCLEKLFNPSEIDYILLHDFPLLVFWKLWAAKEAAYKAWQRKLNVEPIFNPITFKINSFNETKVIVNKNPYKYFVSIKTTSDFIYASIKSKPNLISKIFKTRDEYSNFLKHLKSKGWDIKKNSYGIPFLKYNTSQKKLPISLSHDQNWVALQYGRCLDDIISPKSLPQKG